MQGSYLEPRYNQFYSFLEQLNGTFLLKSMISNLNFFQLLIYEKLSKMILIKSLLNVVCHNDNNVTQMYIRNVTSVFLTFFDTGNPLGVTQGFFVIAF